MKTQELLEARRAEALALVEQIRSTLAYDGWESPITQRSTLSACANMSAIIDDLRAVYGEILILASYAAFCRQQNVAEECSPAESVGEKEAT